MTSYSQRPQTPPLAPPLVLLNFPHQPRSTHPTRPTCARTDAPCQGAWRRLPAARPADLEPVIGARTDRSFGGSS